MSTAPRYVPHYTVEDYVAWEGDWELFDGIPVAMSPSPYGGNAAMHARLTAVLFNAIDEARCHATVLTEIDWIVARDTVVRPDLVIVCGPAPEKHVNQPPTLVVEILSEATRDRDLSVKRDLYEAEGVRWYLIADPDQRQSVVLRLGNDGRYESRLFAGRHEFDLCPDCTIAVDMPPLA